MASTSTNHSDQQEGARSRGQSGGSRPVGTFLGSAEPSAEAAALAADLRALVDAGLIRRVHNGEIRFELTELGASTAAEE